MKCYEKNLRHLTPPGLVGVSWLISWLKIRRLRRRSGSEQEKREVPHGTRMKPNTTCKSMLEITRTVFDPPLDELTRTRTKVKSSEKASSRAESTQTPTQPSQSVTTMMSQAMWVECMNILRRPSKGKRAIVGNKNILQQSRIRMVLWTIGMCGRQRVGMKHDHECFQRGVRVFVDTVR